MNKVEIPLELDQTRLDQALFQLAELNSRSEALKIIKLEQIEINGLRGPFKPNKKVKVGDILEFDPDIQQPVQLVAQEYPLDIVFEDDNLILINKPSGMVVHPAAGHYDHTLVNYLLNHCKLSDGSQEFRPGIVHRIDKDTSGILVVAKNNKTHIKLSDQFREHSISRAYKALVYGTPQESEGVIHAPIGRHQVDRKRKAIVQDGKDAITRWKVDQRFNKYSLVDCELETGRTHQIRVHLTSINHPILGDPIYGNFKRKIAKNEDLKTVFEMCDGQMLHAYKLGFIHPISGKEVLFEVDLPEKFKALLSYIQSSNF